MTKPNNEAPMTDFERDILRSLNGEDVAGLTWGATMSVAVEWLQGKGFVTRGSNVKITEAGRKAIHFGQSGVAHD